jgi:hypothetical protein
MVLAVDGWRKEQKSPARREMGKRECAIREARQLTTRELLGETQDAARWSIVLDATGEVWPQDVQLGRFEPARNFLSSDAAVSIRFTAYPVGCVLIASAADVTDSLDIRYHVWSPTTAQLESTCATMRQTSGPLQSLPPSTLVWLHPLSQSHLARDPSTRLQNASGLSLAAEISTLAALARGRQIIPVLTLDHRGERGSTRLLAVLTTAALFALSIFVFVVGVALVAIDPCVIPWQPRCDGPVELPPYCA